MIKEDGKACLADYGLTFIIDQTDFTSSKIAGSARWSPPEVLNGGEGSDNLSVRSDIYPYSFKSDSYSLAMTMQEVTSNLSLAQLLQAEYREIDRYGTCTVS